MGGMRSLNCLDVSENKLEHLPEEMGNLISLTDLLVSQNLIDMLPESIGLCLTAGFVYLCTEFLSTSESIVNVFI